MPLSKPLPILSFRSRPGLLFLLRPRFHRSLLFLSFSLLPLLGLAVSSAPWVVSPSPFQKKERSPLAKLRKDQALRAERHFHRWQTSEELEEGRPDRIVAKEVGQRGFR